MNNAELLYVVLKYRLRRYMDREFIYNRHLKGYYNTVYTVWLKDGKAYNIVDGVHIEGRVKKTVYVRKSDIVNYLTSMGFRYGKYNQFFDDKKINGNTLIFYNDSRSAKMKKLMERRQA